jgi:hypothetical protein
MGSKEISAFLADLAVNGQGVGIDAKSAILRFIVSLP